MTDSSGSSGPQDPSDKPGPSGGAAEQPPQAQGYPSYPPPPPPPQYSPQYPGAYPPPVGPYQGSYPPPPPMPYDGYGAGTATAKNGLAITALICGLLAIPCAFIPVLGLFIALPLALIACVTGFIAYRRAQNDGVSSRGMPIAGILLGIVAAIVSVVIAVFAFRLFGEIGGRDFVDCMQSAGADRAAQQQCEDEFTGNFEDRFSVTLTPPQRP